MGVELGGVIPEQAPCQEFPNPGKLRNVMVDLVERARGHIEALCRKFGVKRLDLFGSAAEGTFNPRTSDLDFLVEFLSSDYHGAADRYFGLLEGLEALFHRKVDLVSRKAIQNPYFRKSVDLQRVLLYAA
jgi:predicted nucleotidyltransferase